MDKYPFGRSKEFKELRLISLNVFLLVVLAKDVR